MRQWRPCTTSASSLLSPWKWSPAENPDVDWTYTGGDPDPFLSEMQQRLSHRVWEQAAFHYHGLGAENGVDMTVLHTPHHKQLVARGALVKAGMLYKIATAQIYDGSRVCEHDPDAQVACVLCVFHPVHPCILRAGQNGSNCRRSENESSLLSHLLVPRSPAARLGYPELPVAEDPFVEDFGSLHIMGGHVFTDGRGELRPKTPASGAAVMVSHGSSLMVVCLKHREEELAFCMAGINQWREPSSSLQSRPFGCAGVLRSRFSFGPIVCSSSTASPGGDGEDTCPTPICGRNSGKLTTPSAPSLVPPSLEESRYRGGDCGRTHFTAGSVR